MGVGRPKTKGEIKTLNINIEAIIYELLAKFSESTGITKTKVVEKAIVQYIRDYYKNHPEENINSTTD